LRVELNVFECLGNFEYDYPNFHLNMSCYLSEVISGEITLMEHSDSKWLTIENIKKVKWLPADLVVVEQLVQRFGSNL
jgi:8-oxo-dGTP diphosphatase